MLETARHGHLGLVDGDGAPRVLPVTYAIDGDDLATVVDDKPKRTPGAELARVRWLRHEPRAALTVDHYDDDWSRLAWVQVLGRVVVEDDLDTAAMAALRERYAPYREATPQGPVLRLRPARALCWRAAAS